jgi:pimeloyl-ACP methyl ester carboxylesterase
MSDSVLTEEPLQFGEGGRLFGILTVPRALPRNGQELPVFVFLSAGLLHRVGPSRLYVHLVRDLAQLGFSSLRVDLAGVGDSPGRPGLTNQQSVAADFGEIVGVLEACLGRLRLVLAGLCSGADNAVRLTATDRRVVGMVLLDPICFSDHGFMGRAVVRGVEKYSNPARHFVWLKRRVKALSTPNAEGVKRVDPLTLRDLPTREQLRAAFESIRERHGQVLSVFTGAALSYYNQAGQLGRSLDVERYHQFCTELFWPEVDHTYTLELHRRRLMTEIKTWAGDYMRS